MQFPEYGFYLAFNGTKYTDLSVFYTESRVKIRSREGAVKNTEVAGSKSGSPCWSSSVVLLILANNTKVYLPSSSLKVGLAMRYAVCQSRTQVALATRSHAFWGGIERAWLREAMPTCGQVRCERLCAPCRPREQYYSLKSLKAYRE